MNSELDFSTLVEQKATCTPDKTAIHLERKTPGYVILNRRIERIARAFESQFGVQRGGRIKMPRLAGDLGRCDADESFPLHDGKSRLGYFRRERLPSENKAGAYVTSRCSQMRPVGRADARWVEVPVAYMTKRLGREIGADALIAHVWSKSVLAHRAKSFHTKHSEHRARQLPALFLKRIATRPSYQLRSADRRRAVLSRYIAGDIETAQTLPVSATYYGVARLSCLP
ncbi:hypothetical protein ABIA40_000519 [Bradyrhizobium sp. USDA 223]